MTVRHESVENLAWRHHSPLELSAILARVRTPVFTIRSLLTDFSEEYITRSATCSTMRVASPRCNHHASFHHRGMEIARAKDTTIQSLLRSL